MFQRLRENKFIAEYKGERLHFSNDGKEWFEGDLLAKGRFKWHVGNTDGYSKEDYKWLSEHFGTRANVFFYCWEYSVIVNKNIPLNWEQPKLWVEEEYAY